MPDFNETALAAARAATSPSTGQAGLTPADLLGDPTAEEPVPPMDFEGVCALAGIDGAALLAATGRDRQAPDGFRFEDVRNHVANILQAEADQGAWDNLQGAVAVAIAATPNLSAPQMASICRGFDPAALAAQVDQARTDLIASGRLAAGGRAVAQ